MRWVIVDPCQRVSENSDGLLERYLVLLLIGGGLLGVPDELNIHPAALYHKRSGATPPFPMVCGLTVALSGEAAPTMRLKLRVAGDMPAISDAAGHFYGLVHFSA